MQGNNHGPVFALNWAGYHIAYRYLVYEKSSSSSWSPSGEGENIFIIIGAIATNDIHETAQMGGIINAIGAVAHVSVFREGGCGWLLRLKALHSTAETPFLLHAYNLLIVWYVMLFLLLKTLISIYGKQQRWWMFLCFNTNYCRKSRWDSHLDWAGRVERCQPSLPNYRFVLWINDTLFGYSFNLS